MGTRDQARRMTIRFFLDEFGRIQGKIVPFYIYCKLPNYEPLSQEATESFNSQFHFPSSYLRMKRVLELAGVDYPEAATIVGDNTFIPYCLMLKNILERQGFHFTIDEMKTMFIQAQILSVRRYTRLRKKAERSIAKNGELRFSFPELYDLYGNRLVYFVFAYNGVGKSTEIAKHQAALIRRKKVVLDSSLSRLVTRPLAHLLVVDSGRFLPASGMISRGQVIETIPLSLEEYARNLHREHPMAVVDTGDNLGQRVTMLEQAKEVRGRNCPIHVEMLEASLLEALVRNEERERKEYCLEPEKVYEAYSVLSKLATSCQKRDFSSRKYREIYQLLYTRKWCAWAEESCRFKAHEPNTECGRFCNHCLIHCPHKRFGSRQRVQLSESFPFLFPNEGVFL